MCKIITIINKNKNNSKTLKNLIDINADALSREQSGFSVLRNNNPYYSLDYSNFNKKIAYKNEEVYIIHTRTATAGAVDKKGLHLKSFNGWFWAHNGLVSRFSNVEDYNDSYYFYFNLINNTSLTKKEVEDYINDYGFSGRGVLYNPYKNKMIIFATNDLYIYGLKDCLIFSSYQLDTKKNIIKQDYVLGWTFYKNAGQIEIDIENKQKISDVFIEIKNNKVINIEKLDIKKVGMFNYYSKYYGYSTGYNNSYGDMFNDD